MSLTCNGRVTSCSPLWNKHSNISVATFPKVVNSYCNSSTGEEFPQTMTESETKRREIKFTRVLLPGKQRKWNKILQSEAESPTQSLRKRKGRWVLKIRNLLMERALQQKKRTNTSLQLSLLSVSWAQQQWSNQKQV